MWSHPCIYKIWVQGMSIRPIVLWEISQATTQSLISAMFRVSQINFKPKLANSLPRNRWKIAGLLPMGQIWKKENEGVCKDA